MIINVHVHFYCHLCRDTVNNFVCIPSSQIIARSEYNQSNPQVIHMDNGSCEDKHTRVQNIVLKHCNYRESVDKIKWSWLGDQDYTLGVWERGQFSRMITVELFLNLVFASKLLYILPSGGENREWLGWNRSLIMLAALPKQREVWIGSG